jgi:HD superfamily phosphodiesterase
VATDARKANTMTKREFLNNIINSNSMNAEMVEFATKELAQIDATLEKRKNTLRPKQVENLALAENVAAALNGAELKTASDIYALGIDGVTSVNKASSLLRLLVKMERATVEDVAVKGKGVQKGYKLVVVA